MKAIAAPPRLRLPTLAAAALACFLFLSYPLGIKCSGERDEHEGDHHDHSAPNACSDPERSASDPYCTPYKTKRSLPTDLVGDDGYQWPTLYEEADDMLDASLLMYPMATLRKIAKKEKAGDLSMTGGKKLVDVDVILKEPATAREIEGVLTSNIALLKEALGAEEAEVVDDALDTIIARQSTMPNAAGKRATLEEFNDDNSQEELVYAIATDSALKRVTLGFRGSVTRRDFLQDAQIWMTDEPNPFAGRGKGQPKKMGIHNGFHDYLFYNDTTDDTPKSKYEVIEDQVIAVLKKNPGYKLYVTGHSLGGALSTLFAFLASARDEIPNPVTCVSVASPYVGDSRWKKAFQFAEARGLLRHLRVSNKKDIVTLMPFLSLRLRGYKHVGINLKLYPDTHELIYPKVGKRYQAQAWARIWGNSLLTNPSMKYLVNHGTSEYNRRLDKAHDVLGGLYLNDLYSNRTVVGLLVNRFADRLTDTGAAVAREDGDRKAL
uniref:Fungal lipase-type domain-containing protein n=1 Tax=Odontella aurita TaxID=265563 RepID=A0A7S4MD75_9STRA|mmetsp:Transcript_18218/g.52644  ORF Transcript_18218/g.52644 Transcript_18218/m.52644 type:complete len:492 (+) Transcript_18218:147-1622(+)